MMQAAASVWPQGIDGWLGLILKGAAICGFVGTVLGWWLTNKLNGLGARVDSVTAENAANTSSVKDLGLRMQASEFDRAQIHENVGRLEGMVERNTRALEKAREQDHEDSIKIIDRLARIESNVNIAGALDRLGENLVRAFARNVGGGGD